MSDLAKAFAGLKAHRHPGTQEPRNAGAQGRRGDLAPKHEPQLVRPPAQSSPENKAKSRDPEYAPVKVFLRRDTHKAAARKFEDTVGGDFSDLVEMLLAKYLGTYAPKEE